MTFYNVLRYEIRHRLHGLMQIIYLRHYLKLRSGEMSGKILPYVLHRIVLYGLVLYCWRIVVEYGGVLDSPVPDGCKA